ncbi:MAG: hypothetical protein GQ574_09365 [Crocinitomix sp.]|nr:hypothetical protein [Crocinitomix sp.]
MEAYYIAQQIDKVMPYLLLFCIIIGAIKYKRIETHFKVLWFYLILSLVANIGMKLLGDVFGNNLILIPLFGFFELALFTILYMYYMNLGKLRVTILVLSLLGGGYILYECCTVNIAEPGEFQSYARAVDAFIIVVFSMIYFFDKLSKGTDLNDSALQLNAKILVFFSLNLIFLLPMNFLIGENSINLKFYFWFAYISIVTLFYLIITFSIWKNGRTPKRLRSGSEL